jgi:REP element-mobilizing transposase RayT
MHIPGMFQHVLARGNERRPIFRDPGDCEHFVRLLGAMAERFRVEVWSYVLMGNHYHLIVRPWETSLSRAMHWLCVAHSVWHNRRHDRSGHLYQGRFKAFAVEEEEYLKRLICYIHRNPLRARMVKRVAEYPWSSYAALGYGGNCPEWLQREAVLSLYGGRGRDFRRAVQSYSDEDRSLWEDLRQGVFLGSETGMGRYWRRARPAAHREIPESRSVGPREDVAATAARWARGLGIAQNDLEALRRPIRGRIRPLRDVLMHAVWSEGHYGLAEIARHFGVGYTGVVNARRRAADHLARNRRLRKKFLRSASDK